MNGLSPAHSGLADHTAVITSPGVDTDIEPIQAELERAYARLRSIPAGHDTDPVLQEIERLERALLQRYALYVEQRDSTLPPPKEPS